MKNFFLLTIFAWSIGLSAQSLTPEVIASSGTHFSSASAQLDFTIGETVTATLTAGSNTLTQGFHQPELHFAALENYQDAYQFKLYPNPTEQYVTIESTKEADMQAHIYDTHGKAILVSAIFQQKLTLDVQQLAAGSYILVLTTKAGEPLQSYTVIKKSTY